MRFALPLAAALAALVGSTAYADPPSYRLTCRGGGDMRIAINHDVDSEGRAGQAHFSLYFDRAPQAASVANPPLGSCAWQDRPLNADEPAVLYWRSPDLAFATSITTDGGVFADTRGYRFLAEGRSELAQDINFAIVSFFNGLTFDVMAYNAEGRVMAVTDTIR